MRLITRTLISTKVAVRANFDHEHAIEVSTAGITNILGEANAAIKVAVESDGAVTFARQAEKVRDLRDGPHPLQSQLQRVYQPRT